MSRSRSATALIIRAVICGAGLFVAANLSGAGETGAADQVLASARPPQTLRPAKSAIAIQAVAKALGNPVAYGFVQWDGVLRSSSGNVAVGWNETKGRYEISIAGLSYHSGPYITFVTAEGQGGIYLPATMEDNNALIVRIGKITGEPGIQASFQFVTYKIS